MSLDTRNPRRLPAHLRRLLAIARADLEVQVFEQRGYGFIQSALAIPNEAGASFRADNNTALQAVANFSAGATAPGTTYAYQPWADTANNVLKRRNAANSAWIVAWSLDESFVISRSSNTILGLSDYGKTFLASSSFTQTLTAAATLGDGWFCFYRNDGAGVITVDPNASETINGATTLVLYPGQACRIACNGSAFATQGLGVLAAAQNSQGAAYTTALTDAEKTILHPAADNNPRIFTIDSNANVAYPINTSITFVNEINTVTIAITSDTMTLAGAGTTGSRTLAASGIATALKVAATKWIISGVGLS